MLVSDVEIQSNEAGCEFCDSLCQPQAFNAQEHG